MKFSMMACYASMLLPSSPQPRPTDDLQKPRKSRRVFDFPTETLMKYAHLRQDEAARALGVAPITLKRICQRRKLRWPYRAFKAQFRLAAAVKHATKPSQLPAYCIYNRQVSADVPALQPIKFEPSAKRPTLPSLTEKLGAPVSAYARGRLSQLSSQRPHLADIAPIAPITSLLPRLNIPAISVYHTPTHAEKMAKKKNDPAPPVSPNGPPRPRFGLLPLRDISNFASRSITPRFRDC